MAQPARDMDPPNRPRLTGSLVMRRGKPQRPQSVVSAPSLVPANTQSLPQEKPVADTVQKPATPDPVVVKSAPKAVKQKAIKRVSKTVRVPPEISDQLRALAKEKAVTQQHLMMGLIKDCLNRA